MRNAKRFLAVAMAATMVLAPATVFADENTSGSITGAGDYEGYLVTDVYNVTVPTVSDVDFVIDPQGLLYAADSETYSAGEGAVYFTNTKSNTSDEITITNKSSYEINVSLAITVEASGIELVEESDLEAATTPSLYLGLETKANDDEGYGTADAITSSSYISETTKVESLEDDYEIVASSTAVEGVTQSPSGYYYTYELSTSAGNGSFVSYQLTGACNTTDGWSNISTSDAVSTSIVWSCEKYEENVAPSITTTAYTYTKGGDLDIAVNLGNGTLAATGIASVGAGSTANGTFTAQTTSNYSLSDDGKTLTITGMYTGASSGSTRYLQVVFNDAAATTVVIELTIN